MAYGRARKARVSGASGQDSLGPLSEWFGVGAGGGRFGRSNRPGRALGVQNIPLRDAG